MKDKTKQKYKFDCNLTFTHHHQLSYLSYTIVTYPHVVDFTNCGIGFQT